MTAKDQVKPDLELVQISHGESFKAWAHGYPFRTVRWHFHPEYELHLITATSGSYFVGDFIGEFDLGNLVLTGPNLPHNWVTNLPEGTSIPRFCLVLQFSEEFIRPLMAALPELTGFETVLAESRRGALFPPSTAKLVKPLFAELIEASGAQRIARFMDIIHLLTRADGRRMLAGAGYQADFSLFMSAAVNRALMHIGENLTKVRRTTNLARIAGLNPSAFSRSFRQHTGMTPIKYITRLRIDLACSLLMSDLNRPITDIAFDVGFNNLSNFNRQFLSQKGMTPSRFRYLHLFRKGSSLTDAAVAKSQRTGVHRHHGVNLATA
jgi:AraC-like DNA-binding protein